ncbi:methyltransferase-like protein 27 [Mercenaria mercenaria]|uniref:methyltransferase-like protein 27 n=1 Tax=Mercenaria mercenaria TaxID=6596 RepID=UPI00234F0B9A|nr:methyltransferase-like protein 27 [Mercenaria mercenaria]
MAKYIDQYRALMRGMSPEEVADYYTNWAENTKYDQDLKPGIYNCPTIAANEVAKCFPEDRDRIKIIDIACGTGRVGVELAVHGFKDIDGLDGSDGMLKQCQDKGLYKNLYKEFCGHTTLPIDDDVYDCLVVSGGMGENHIPLSGIFEMIRIVKPGGFIILIVRKEFVDRGGEDIDNLETFVAKLESEDKVEILEHREVANYSFDRDGVIFKMKKSCI